MTLSRWGELTTVQVAYFRTGDHPWTALDGPIATSAESDSALVGTVIAGLSIEPFSTDELERLVDAAEMPAPSEASPLRLCGCCGAVLSGSPPFDPVWWQGGELWWLADQDYGTVETAWDEATGLLLCDAARFEIAAIAWGSTDEPGNGPSYLATEIGNVSMRDLFAPFLGDLKVAADWVRWRRGEGRDRFVSFVVLWECSQEIGGGYFGDDWEVAVDFVGIVRPTRTGLDVIPPAQYDTRGGPQMQITTQRRSGDWMACLDGDLTKFETGRTEEEAVGTLIRTRAAEVPDHTVIQTQLTNWRASRAGVAVLGAEAIASGSVQIRRLPPESGGTGAPR